MALPKKKRIPTAIIDSGTTLEDKLRAFASVYLSIKGSNVARGEQNVLKMAGKTFGCSADVCRKWLAYPIVKEEISKALAVLESKKGIDADKVLEELAEIALSDIKSFYERDGATGIKLKDILSMGRESKAIKTIRHRRTTRGDRDGTISVIDEYQYEMWDKLGALKTLADIKKLTEPNDGDSMAKSNVFIMLPDNGFSGKSMVKRAPILIEGDVSDAENVEESEMERAERAAHQPTETGTESDLY